METANRLAAETSPYLRQHAANPVDWYPWGDDAFAEARRRDVPVFLSVGYSACHWCHVMAHESFEDDQVAAALNAGFVSVKVDREERPDVDSVYMAAVLVMNGHGGWPMSVFCTPDGRPFFAGTYFPPTDRHGVPGIMRVLGAVRQAWTERRAEVERQADALAEAAGAQAGAGALEPASGRSPVPSPDYGDTLAHAVDLLAGRHDRRWGGFGPAPKFPQPALVELCLRHHRRTGDDEALAMAELTLRAMAAGGINDHVGGGFCRYSTDETWTVPHFEKMLYDQAGLARVYLHAWQATGRPEWLQVVEDTVGYVLRDLRAPGGGLCSAEDADSEGVEGRFYLWSPPELDEVLGPESAEAARRWGVDQGANFEGGNILRLELDTPLVRGPDVERWRRALLDRRQLRVRPGLDDKVLTEWNAMFCSALAECAGATGRRDWALAAEEVGRFLLDNSRRGDGRWLRSWQGGRARHLAYAADYAWLVDAFTRLAELTGRPEWLERAVEVAGALVSLFRPDSGPLWTTGDDAEALLVRPVELLDDATPSATAVGGAALVRLGALAGDERLSETGAELVASLSQVVSEHPLASAWGLGAGELSADGIVEVVVAGDRPDLLEVVRSRYEPTAVLCWGERSHSPLWEGRVDGLGYVCRQRVCAAPAHSAEELAAALAAPPQGRVTTGTAVQL